MKSVFVFVFIFLMSCNVQTIGTLKDEQIEKSVRENVHSICKKIVADISNKDSRYLKEISSKQLDKKVDLAMYDSIVHSVRLAPGKQYPVFDEDFLIYRIQGIDTGSVRGDFNDNIFKFNYINPTHSEKTYVCFFSVPADITDLRWIFACVFSEENTQWELLSLDVGIKSYKGLTAPEIYKKANLEVNKGNYFASLFLMHIIMMTSNPCGDKLHYAEEQNMVNFSYTLVDKIKGVYAFPLKVKTKAGDVSILNLDMATTTNVYPKVIFQTDLINDNLKIREAAIEINKSINSVMPSIASGSDSIVYSHHLQQSPSSISQDIITLPSH